MEHSRSTKDRRGIEIRPGDFVRILSLDEQFLASLPSDELEDVRSMVGQSFEVEEIDEYGSAWVTKWWERGNGESECHSVGLSASEMERVEREDAN